MTFLDYRDRMLRAIRYGIDQRPRPIVIPLPVPSMFDLMRARHPYAKLDKNGWRTAPSVDRRPKWVRRRVPFAVAWR